MGPFNVLRGSSYRSISDLSEHTCVMNLTVWLLLAISTVMFSHHGQTSLPLSPDASHDPRSRHGGWPPPSTRYFCLQRSHLTLWVCTVTWKQPDALKSAFRAPEDAGGSSLPRLLFSRQGDQGCLYPNVPTCWTVPGTQGNYRSCPHLVGSQLLSLLLALLWTLPLCSLPELVASLGSSRVSAAQSAPEFFVGPL